MYADNWWTLGLGVALVLAGTLLRAWAIVSLGRYFRRDVTIEPGQHGLTFGSWVSAGIALLIIFVGMLTRIRVEERALSRAFGARYTAYAKSTARVIPHVCSRNPAEVGYGLASTDHGVG